MAESGGSSRVSNAGVFPPPDDTNPLKTLYPMVNEEDTPLPHNWSSKDKYTYIGLSQYNLRVHYKGYGKTHKDAASVRATHPIPAACGLYYYEITIVSKGRDGYMGIGLSLQGVNMNRLPGWDKNSYGYHGDDGHSFCSSGAGQPYGPTYTTGDVIGCGVNLVDRTCFYTKNGMLLGTAFRDLPKDLYPTVGLQTPGEVVDTNFGTSGPFMYDLRCKIQEVRESVRNTILSHPLSLSDHSLAFGSKGKMTDIMNRMVSGYLVHHGYCCTAEAFSRATHMDFNEEITSIRNRQRISRLVMAGDIGGSIVAVEELYPSLFKENPNLHFMLQVRQFIEIVKGTEQQQNSWRESPASSSQVSNGTVDTAATQSLTPKHTSVIQSTKSALSNKSNRDPPALETEEQLNQRNRTSQASQLMAPLLAVQQQQNIDDIAEDATSNTISGSSPTRYDNNQHRRSTSPASSLRFGSQQAQQSLAPPATSLQAADSDTEMECLDDTDDNVPTNISDVPLPPLPQTGTITSTATASNSRPRSSINGVSNGFNKHHDAMLVDDESDSTTQHNGDPPSNTTNGALSAPTSSSSSSGSQSVTVLRRGQMEKVLEFGRHLQSVSQSLRKTHGKNKANKRMLQDAYSLLAYNDPSSSPMGWQLDTLQREPVCQSLNSAILEGQNLPSRPALEVSASHTKQLINLMSRSGLGASAFTHIDKILRFNPKPFVPENTYAMPEHVQASVSGVSSAQDNVSEESSKSMEQQEFPQASDSRTNLPCGSKTRNQRSSSSNLSFSISGKRPASSLCASADIASCSLSPDLASPSTTTTRVSSVISPTDAGVTSATYLQRSPSDLIASNRTSCLPVNINSCPGSIAAVTTLERGAVGNGDSNSGDEELMEQSDGAIRIGDCSYELDFVLQNTTSVVDFQPQGSNNSRNFSSFGDGSGASGAAISGSDGDFYYDYMTSSDSSTGHQATGASNSAAGDGTDTIASDNGSTLTAIPAAGAALDAEDEPMALDLNPSIDADDNAGLSTHSSTTSASSSTTSSSAALASTQQDSTDGNMSDVTWPPSTRQ